MDKKKKRQLNSGMITVEATISLTTFIFAILVILSVMNVCIAQAKVGVAINSTAKELSQYSYLYAITGLKDSVKAVADSGNETKEDVNNVLSSANTVFTEIQNLGKSSGEKIQSGDVDGFLTGIESGYKDIQSSGGELKNAFDAIASDPKKLALGLAKIAATDTLNVATSRLIAGPLSKALCKKNLVSTKGGDPDTLLKFLHVVPGASGSYYDGLDFSKSTIFPSGSDEIRVVVSYKVKVIPYLPIDYEFKFTQTAVTHGWLAGESSYKSTKERLETKGNDSIWITATIPERSKLIRDQGIADLTSKEGYQQTKKLTDVPLYNPSTNEFCMISSMNPLYSPEGSENLTLDDISETAITEQISLLCGTMKSTTDGRKEVTTYIKGSDGSTTNKTNDCTNAKNKIIIVVPDDPGLKEKIQAYADKADKKGVEVVIQTGYGSGVRNVAKENTEGEDNEN